MILIVGATGNVGSEVFARLTASGKSVRALSHNPESAAKLKAPGVEVVPGDLENYRSLEAALDGVDEVFLATTATPYMAAQHLNLVTAARSAGVKRFVKISICGASDDIILRAARWQYIVERTLADFGMPFIIIRPNIFMQNFLGQADAIGGMGSLFAPAKDARVSFVDVRDIADCAVAALTEPGHLYKTYTVTGPEALDYNQLAAVLSDVAGRPEQYVDMPLEAAREAFSGAGMPDWLVDIFLELFEWTWTGEGAVVTGDMQRITGNEPRTFRQFAQDYAQVFAAPNAA